MINIDFKKLGLTKKEQTKILGKGVGPLGWPAWLRAASLTRWIITPGGYGSGNLYA